MDKILDWLAEHLPLLIVYGVGYYSIYRLLATPKQLPKHVWTFVYPTDPKSPKIMGLSDDTHIIFYPKESTPYRHVLTDKCKFVEIISGEIHEKVSGKTFKKGDTLKIYPTEEYVPFTTNKEALIKVCINDCNLSIKDAC